jgi:hypothetical protein
MRCWEGSVCVIAALAFHRRQMELRQRARRSKSRREHGRAKAFKAGSSSARPAFHPGVIISAYGRRAWAFVYIIEFFWE